MRKIKMGLLAGLLVGLLVTGCGSDSKKVKENETAAELIAEDLQENYPEQPVEVAELYCAISKEIHAENTSDDQAKELLDQMRMLFDVELLAQNDYEQHLKKLNKERKQYQDKKITIVRYTIQDKDDVVIGEDQEGRECCHVDISYSILQDSNQTKNDEQIIMRKDGDGRWKILGTQLISIGESGE